MTRLALSASLLLLSCTGSARDAPTTGSAGVATPTAAASIVRYVAIGASDTVGAGATDPANGSWPARLAARLPAGATYANLGVSGSLTRQAATAQLPAAIAARPTLVTVWLAVNDFNAGLPIAEYREAVGDLVARLVADTGAAIFVGNVPDLRRVPIYAGVATAPTFIERIDGYNAAIAAVAARYRDRVTVVDLFHDVPELADQTVVAADGFHPSDVGYALIAERFVTAFGARGVPLRVSGE